LAEEISPSKAPRRIRKVETVREKAEKSSIKQDKPKKRGRVRKVLRIIFNPVRFIWKILRKIGHFKPFRVVGYILVPPYFRNSWKELKLVTWPTKRESRRLTLAVIIFAVVFGVLVAIVDYGLDKLFKRILLKS
jgi:preprotein translocase subunit SecE